MRSMSQVGRGRHLRIIIELDGDTLILSIVLAGEVELVLGANLANKLNHLAC